MVSYAPNDCAWCDPDPEKHPSGSHPQCSFTGGTLWCTNDPCPNPHHNPTAPYREVSERVIARAKEHDHARQS